MVDIVFLGLNDVGERIYRWLTTRDDTDVIALLTEKGQLELVKRLNPDLLVSAGFRHIVPDDILEIPTRGSVNLHKSYLPYNRGANPNVWSIIEDAPAGVTIHYMTGEVDQGPIIDRRKVPTRPDDTGRTLYDRLEKAQVDQFKDVWQVIRDGDPDIVEQDPGEGTYHYKGDFVDLWELDVDETVRVGDFLDRLRALTFPPFRNAYFDMDGERFFVDVDITREADDDTQEMDGKMVPEYTGQE